MILRSLLALLVTLLIDAPVRAQGSSQSSLFPFYGFELNKLPETYLYKTKSGGKPERSLASAYFVRSRAGRIEGAEITIHCANDDLPAALEKPPGSNAWAKLRYAPSPQTARFTCRTKDHVWDVEYRTGVTVAGDVYTFDGSVRAVRRDDTTWIKTAAEQAVIAVSGKSCTPRSFRREVVDEFYGHTRVSRLSVADGNTACKLYAKE